MTTVRFSHSHSALADLLEGYSGGQAGTAMLTYNRYNAMSEALNKTGRPILYSLCNWGEDGPWNWAQTSE